MVLVHIDLAFDNHAQDYRLHIGPCHTSAAHDRGMTELHLIILIV